MIDISPKDLAIVQSILRDAVPECEVRAFGSRVAWTAKDYSDLDLVVVGAAALERKRLYRLQEAFQESALPFRVDVLDWHAVSDGFRAVIAKQYEVVQKAECMVDNVKVSKTESMCYRPFEELFEIPLRNGLTRPKKVRGNGIKMVNMGEIFAYDRLQAPPMEYVPISEKEREVFLLKEGDLLFARQSLVHAGAGKCSIVKKIGEETTFESHLIRCRLNNDVALGDYYYYFFRSQLGKNAISSIVEQVAAAGIRGSDLARLMVPNPTIEEQEYAANILRTFDEKIELNRQMNATLEAMAQALFKSWFIDFDPVIDNALAAGNPIPDELADRAAAREDMDDDAKRLPEATRKLFPAEFEESELGWIPAGWSWSTIGEVVNVVGGGTPSTKDPEFWDVEGNAFCTPKDMSRLQTKILNKTERYLSEKGVEKVSSGQLPKGTVLMSSRAPIGYLAVADMPVSVNQGIIAMSCDETISKMFLLNWLQVHMEEIVSRANGSTFLEISKKNFRTIPFLMPSDQVLEQFNISSATLFERISICARECERLSLIRDAVISEIFSSANRA